MTLLLWALPAALAVTDPLPAACPTGSPDPSEALTVYLITASPGPQPFSFIGHSSLWLRDGATGLDHVWEYGVIDSSKQEPLSSLLLGTLNCSWQVRPVRREARDYVRQQRTAVAHLLDLSPAARADVRAALQVIARDLDRTDRFHWRTNSCATKVRDVVAASLDGAVQRALSGPAPLTPHDDVMRHVAPVPWAWLGLKLAAGAPTDAPQTWWQAGFVPVRLLEGLQQVEVAGGAPLVGPPCTLAEGPNRWPPPAAPDRTGLMWAAGLGLAGALTGLGAAGRRAAAPRALGGVLIAAFGLVFGLVGTLTLTLWGASALDDFGPNQTALLAHPLTLALVPFGLAWARGRTPWGARPITLALAALGAASLALALMPMWPQAALDRVGLLWPPLLAAALWARWYDRPPSG